MKTNFLLPVLITAALLAFNFNTRAQDDGTNCDCQDECNISGQETMDAVIVLTATDNAPTNATGIAKIESENEDGNESATVELTTFGLDAGAYDLSITLISTGSNVDLGQFTVGSDGEGDDGEDWQGDHQDSFRLDWQGGGIGCNWGGFTNWGSWTNWSDTNFFSGGWADCTNGWTDTNPCPGPNGPFISKTDVTLPADVNPTDIGQITVSDANGNAILIGDLTTPAPGSVINISATVQVTAGPAAPFANGTAHLQSTATKGKWKHQFTLAASGMNAKSTYKLNVNGKTSGGARSSKTGQVTIKKLPSHVPALRSLRLLDARGNEAASAKF
ncbi:MAG TPA: hypothetical protein VGI88_12945 [Verrucomicrobiae bacterium]|jgi:hypothetical protein